MRVAFKTLGCRLNQFETDSIITQLKNHGMEIVSFKQPAEIYVINTCTVTGKSDAKSRNAIKRAIKTNKNSIVIVTGCYADTEPGDIEAIPGVNYIISNEKKHAIIDLILKRKPDIDNVKGNAFNFNSPVKGTHTRAYLKIQDGCNSFCSYCKIPYARGKEKSRSIDNVINEFKKIVDSGIKEVVLTGINIGSHEQGIEKVLKKLLEIPGDFRIHVSSIEMRYVTDSLLDIFKSGKMCYHLHVPLQSGSDKILKRMNRNYTKNDFLKLMQKIRLKYPDINITTDIIVGFPGETEKDFEQTLEVIKTTRFSHVHTFKYSPRKGTKAFLLNNDVKPGEKKHRSLMARELSSSLNAEYKNKLVGKNVRVLCETIVDIDGEKFTKGKSDDYSEVFIKGVYKKGVFVECRIYEFSNGKLFAI